MGIEVFINEAGKLIKTNNFESLSNTKGWWNSIVVEDIDNDGDKDIIAGNQGLNYKHHASKEKPFHVYTKDFDNNGVEDIILAKYYKSKQVPARGKSCTSQQIPFLKEKIKTYDEFANSDLEGILGEGIASSLHYQVTELRSGIFINNGKGEFDFKAFPLDVQKSPINSIIYKDFDGDKIKDILLAGNNYQSEIETTRSDAGIGSFLKGTLNKDFTYIPNSETGFFANSNVRAMKYVKNNKSDLLLIINNNEQHKIFKVNNNEKK